MKPKRATSLKNKKLYSNDEDLLRMKLPPNHIKWQSTYIINISVLLLHNNCYVFETVDTLNLDLKITYWRPVQHLLQMANRTVEVVHFVCKWNLKHKKYTLGGGEGGWYLISKGSEPKRDFFPNHTFVIQWVEGNMTRTLTHCETSKHDTSYNFYRG